jgi:hypothetical protein
MRHRFGIVFNNSTVIHFLENPKRHGDGALPAHSKNVSN